MIFATGLNKIYESISKQPANKQEALLNDLQERIVNNPALAYKFELLESIKNNKKAFSKETATKFFAILKENHEKFLKTNNSVAIFYKEEKKLFEYFNINQKDVSSSKLDLIINKKNNELNESVILEYITDKNRLSKKEMLQHKQVAIKETFIRLKQRKNLDGLENQLRAIEIFVEGFRGSEERKRMFKESIRAIRKTSFSDFNQAADKTYKLKLLSEVMLKEYTDDSVIFGNIPSAAEDKTRKNSSDKDFKAQETEFGKAYSGVKIDVELQHIKNVTAEIPEIQEGEAADKGIEINFDVIIYPTSVKLADSMNEALILEELFNKLKVPFVNKCIYQAGLRLLDPVGVNWNSVTISKNINPEKPGKEMSAELQAKGYYSLPVNINVIVFPTRRASTAAFENEIEEMVSQFDALLPKIDALSDVLTPEIQVSKWETTTKGRSTSYGDRSGKNKYYKDARGTARDDRWTDTVFRGDADESQVGEYDDEQAYKDANTEDPDKDSRIQSDEETEKQAVQNAKRGTMWKPGKDNYVIK